MPKPSKDYTDQSTYHFVSPCRITPGRIRVLMTNLENEYPTQFIKEMHYTYSEKTNQSSLLVITDGERWPGQFSGVDREQLGGSRPTGEGGETVGRSSGGDTDGTVDRQ